MYSFSYPVSTCGCTRRPRPVSATINYGFDRRGWRGRGRRMGRSIANSQVVVCEWDSFQLSKGVGRKSRLLLESQRGHFVEVRLVAIAHIAESVIATSNRHFRLSAQCTVVCVLCKCLIAIIGNGIRQWGCRHWWQSHILLGRGRSRKNVFWWVG